MFFPLILIYCKEKNEKFFIIIWVYIESLYFYYGCLLRVFTIVKVTNFNYNLFKVFKMTNFYYDLFKAVKMTILIMTCSKSVKMTILIN